MNQEDEQVKYQSQYIKGDSKKKDQNQIEDRLIKENCQQNNFEQIPKEYIKKGKANEKQTNITKEKSEGHEQKQLKFQKQSDVHEKIQKQNQNQQQGQFKQRKQEQSIQGGRNESNKYESNFQQRENNKEQYQKYQGKQNKQQNYEKKYNNTKRFNYPVQYHSHNNNKPLTYPQVEEEENNNNNNQNLRYDKNEQEKSNNNNNSQNRNSKQQNNHNNQQIRYNQNDQINDNNYQKENPHQKQVRRDRNPERNYRSIQQEQNKIYYKKRFNNYDFDRQDNDNSFDDDYYYKKEYRYQSKKYQRRDSYDYLLNKYDQKEEDDRRNGKQYNNKKGKKNNRKNQYFEQYWTEEQIEKGKADNEIFEGIFIGNEFTLERSTIKCPILKKKVYINSFVESNRALHGALVAFKIIKIQKRDQESEEEQEEEIIEQIEKKDSKIQKENANDKQEKIEDEENNDDWEDVNSEEDDDNISEISDIFVVKKKVPLTKIQQLQKAQLIGKVVGIRKNPFENRQMIGKINFKEKNGQQIKQIETKEELINYIESNYYISFKCVNKRIPYFNVKKLLSFNYELDNEEPVQKFMDYVSQRYFSAKYLQWGRNSRYPVVELIKEVGVQGNIDVECEAILTENSVYDNEFSDLCKEEMKAYTHDSIAKESVKRMDLRQEYICSIDPVTARDLDDALSIKDLGNGIYEIGVHIADVSHFVTPNSEVDKEAILRTTSVYLVHKVIPMLPRILCEELCSLNRDVERLAFSVFFQMTTEGEVLWDTFKAAKSVIKSCAQLSYDIVNQLIDGEIQQFSEGEQRYHIANGFDENILKNKILLLNTIAQKRRNKRLEGSLTFEKSKLRFNLNSDLFPTGYSEEKRGLAQFMVEEWMLLANQFVGKKLVEYDVKTAILRQHISPKSEKLDFYRKLLEAAGLNEMAQNLDVSTSRNLKLTMAKVDQIQSQEIKLILGFRLLKLMEAAQYFVVDDTPLSEWRHYALDFDIYTHFTSPIRRYPDILVHRRLQIALEQQEIDQTGETRDKLKAIMQHCNDCKLNARRVSDQCDQLFLALLLKANPIEINGYILSINKQHIDIIIPKYNLERKVELKNLKNTYKYTVEEVSENTNELIISYNDPDDERGVRLYFVKQFQEIKIKLSGTDTFPIEYQIQIIINNKVQI
ncbi:unnamed protein product [Paramecium sonneborni]|uniref:RNB domain-containing protein n=1 Tax=Paramecium sonneborni TaxID=65129 RepID=A0A8S1R6N3_9CILI|nr:unnamed protein product [Paramecium sonneborni]